MNKPQNFEKKQITYIPLEDTFCINTAKIQGKSYKYKKLLKRSIFSSGFLLVSSVVLMNFTSELGVGHHIDYILSIFLLSLPLFITTSLMLFSLKENEEMRKLPKWERRQPLTPAIAYALISAILLSLPTLFVTDSNGGCFGSTATSDRTLLDNKITHL